MALLDSLVNNDLVNKFVKSKTDTVRRLASSTLGNAASRIGDSSVTGDQYQFNQYDVQGLTYPSDLLGNDISLSSKNYVIFYINVSVDSKILKNESTQVVEGVTRDKRGALIGAKINKLQASVGTAALGALAGGVAGKFLGDAPTVGGLFGAAAGAAGINIIAPSPGDKPAAEEKQPEFSRPQKRLKKAIALHMPNNLRTGYRVTWGEAETMGFQALSMGAKEIGNAITSKDGGSVKQAAGLAGDVLKNISLQAMPKGAGIGAGLAANPKKEQAFEGVEFRDFTYNYQFAPRDADEAKAVFEIVQTFKYHMHPEYLEATGFTYVYPSEFDIVFYNGSEENPWIHKHSSCVLTNMDIDYAPNNTFVTFSNGMPTIINVTLSFRELMTITKETVEKGL